MANAGIDLDTYFTLDSWGLHDVASRLYLGRSAEQYVHDAIVRMSETYACNVNNEGWACEFAWEAVCVTAFLTDLKEYYRRKPLEEEVKTTHVKLLAVPNCHPEYVDMCRGMIGKHVKALRDSFHGMRPGCAPTSVVVKVGSLELTYAIGEYVWCDKDGNLL